MMIALLFSLAPLHAHDASSVQVINPELTPEEMVAYEKFRQENEEALKVAEKQAAHRHDARNFYYRAYVNGLASLALSPLLVKTGVHMGYIDKNWWNYILAYTVATCGTNLIVKQFFPSKSEKFRELDKEAYKQALIDTSLTIVSTIILRQAAQLGYIQETLVRQVIAASLFSYAAKKVTGVDVKKKVDLEVAYALSDEMQRQALVVMGKFKKKEEVKN